MREDITLLKMDLLSPSLERLAVVGNGWAKESGRMDRRDSTKMFMSGFPWRDVDAGNEL